MKKFSDYIGEQMQAALNENTSQIGLTDTYGGDAVMGPHHHEFWIFDETGEGRTSDAIPEASKLNEPTPVTTVGGHVHFIHNGVVQPCGDGHTHKLMPPKKIDADTRIFSCNGCDCAGLTPIPGIKVP